jgi:hypothetical protein
LIDLELDDPLFRIPTNRPPLPDKLLYGDRLFLYGDDAAAKRKTIAQLRADYAASTFKTPLSSPEEARVALAQWEGVLPSVNPDAALSYGQYVYEAHGPRPAVAQSATTPATTPTATETKDDVFNVMLDYWDKALGHAQLARLNQLGALAYLLRQLSADSRFAWLSIKPV